MKKWEALLRRIGTCHVGWCLGTLGLAVFIHVLLLIIFGMFTSKGCFISKSLAHDIPFTLLMFGLIMASFVPMLVYSYTLRLIERVSRDRMVSEETRRRIFNFYRVINLIVSESTILIAISIIVGGFVYIETNIYQLGRFTPGFFIGYYIWYLFTAIIWSIGRVYPSEGREIWGLYGYYYLWLISYILISLFLVSKYLNDYFCSNAIIWLKYLIIVTSIWLLLFSIFWIIPSDRYWPLFYLRRDIWR